MVAFLSWEGGNFEDAILVSERLVHDDRFTSIHIEEFECVARETKLGREDITRDIPNVGDEVLRNLDDSGIIRIGAEIKPGDILVGKISPKGETQLSPEERLLRAIFGDKAGDVKDSSLKASPGVYGTVIDVKTLISRGVDKDERTKSIENFEVTNGPDLRVYLTSGGDVKNGIHLEKLKASSGDQNCSLSDDIDVDMYNTVVIYCQPFGVYFGQASMS